MARLKELAAGGSAEGSRENGRRYDHLSREALVALLERRDREGARIGLNWAADQAERDRALNDQFVTLRLAPDLCNRLAPWDNLVIEGENFDALRWLRMAMPGRVKCVFVDPPYNTGRQDWAYNDSYRDPSDPFHDTTWLEFLHRRFRLARDLLADDGVMFVCINDEKRALLELMLDQTLPGMKVGSLVWRTRTGGNEGGPAFLSGNHEHILVYAGEKFRFGGFGKSLDRYGNPDNDPRGDWASDNLRQPKDRTERENGYFTLIDPETGIHYPADPDQVWRFTQRSSGKARGGVYIEDLISDKRIKWPSEQPVRVWSSLEELEAAIDSGDVPRSRTSLFIRRGLPNLFSYIGVPIGFGTPRIKRFKGELRTATQPLSSWITPRTEARSTLSGGESVWAVAGTNDEGTKALKSVFGSKVFNYPKPVSLVRELVRQATGPGDLVVDFFAGSGTTAQAVMELNAEDGFGRRFVMVNHDEATQDDPNRNLARDVLAERVRRLNAKALASDSGEPAPFAYLRTRLIPAERMLDGASAGEGGAPDDLSAEDVWLAVQAMHGLPLAPLDRDQPLQVAEGEIVAVAFCDQVTEAALDRLRALAGRRKPIHCYGWTPGPIRRALEGVEAEIHRVPDALWQAFRS